LARIKLVDDQSKIFINGREAVSGNWGRGKNGEPIGHRPGDTDWVDVSVHFRKGRNEVRFWVWNEPGCCDVSATFQLKVGEKVILIDRIDEQDSTSGVKFDKTYVVSWDDSDEVIADYDIER
jgi:hypothetical protein